jgi:hypothetical protein
MGAVPSPASWRVVSVDLERPDQRGQLGKAQARRDADGVYRDMRSVAISIVRSATSRRAKRSSAAVSTNAARGRKHKRGRAALDGSRRREAGMRPVEQPAVEAGVRALIRDALVADCRAGLGHPGSRRCVGSVRPVGSPGLPPHSAPRLLGIGELESEQPRTGGQIPTIALRESDPATRHDRATRPHRRRASGTKRKSAGTPAAPQSGQALSRAEALGRTVGCARIRAVVRARAGGRRLGEGRSAGDDALRR